MDKYLIIGGSTKCGTTSVFKYFEFHPEICPCIMKESRYFLEKSYQIDASKRGRKKYNSFQELFLQCESTSTRLEATPDYLYSKHAAEKIMSEAPSCKMVFILREPVDRLLSWYRYAMLNGLLPGNTTLEQYIQLQSNNNGNSPQHLRSLEQGRYGQYLEHYYTLFSEDQIHVCYYETLVSDPKKFCMEIASFAGIETGYFNQFDYKVFNKSNPVKSVEAHKLFRRFKRTVRPFTRMLSPSLRKRLKLAGYNLEAVYSAANAPATTNNTQLSSELSAFLEKYYADDKGLIEKLTGTKPPWS